ncbi:MAG: hypothetical protein M1813_006086 [Trichoglossum hirsutum]|nr:MAG: hypothetical protein M1813_006086 [Trichoglossum hirsutum]
MTASAQYAHLPSPPPSPAIAMAPSTRETQPQNHQQLIQTWSSALEAARSHPYTRGDKPSYWHASSSSSSSSSSLVSNSTVRSFSVGTGANLFRSMMPTVLATAREELLIVTCFWATGSEAVAELAELLRRLSDRARPPRAKLRVRILLSSLSPTQKLLHRGRPTPHRPERLGLPPAHDLPGLSLSIRSLFVRPFSVMHPKFVVVDRSRAWLMSWNLSWEEWFEGSLELEGNAVAGLVEFWSTVWGEDAADGGGGSGRGMGMGEYGRRGEEEEDNEEGTSNNPSPPLLSTVSFPPNQTTTLVLPSPHHRNPHFRPFPLRAAPPPPTPLNLFLLTLLSTAQTSIFMQTPNLTSPPVLDALAHALARGVDVSITTSRRMMWPEQLATAANTTECAIRSLKRRTAARRPPPDLEAAALTTTRNARLRISYFRPISPAPTPHEPRKSHLKLTIVDGDVAVLGSGNMDRASWYTSQELGIALFGREVVAGIKAVVEEGMVGRMEDA